MYFSVLGIQRAGGFVEQEDRCVLQKGAGDAQALLLPAGEHAALVADDRFVALGLGHDEIMRVAQLQPRPRCPPGVASNRP